jgi:D-arginine dehydrogenase
VLVIGHGLAGAAVACAMQPFASVVLVERARATPSPALLLPPDRDTVEARLAAASQTFYAQQAGGLAGRPVTVLHDLLRLTSADQPDLREGTVPVADSEPIEAAEIADKLPFLASPDLAGGLLVPGALDLNTGALHRAYRDTFTTRGGRLVEEAESIAIEGDGAPWRVSAGQARFEAKVLVDAAGRFAEAVAISAGVPPLGLVARRRTTIHFEAAVPAPDGMPVIESPDRALLLKPDGATFVAMVTDPEPIELAATNPATEPGRDDRAGAIARLGAATQLRVRRVVESASTFLIQAPDQTPVVGQDDLVPGFFWVAGEGQDGALAPALASAAASLLVSGVLPDDLTALKIVPEDLLPLRFREQRED